MGVVLDNLLLIKLYWTFCPENRLLFLFCPVAIPIVSHGKRTRRVIVDEGVSVKTKSHSGVELGSA